MEKIPRQPPHSSRSQLHPGRRLTAAAITVVLLVLVSACGPSGAASDPNKEVVAAATTVQANNQATRTPRPRRTATPTASASSTPTRSITLLPSALRGQVVHFWHPYTKEVQVLLDLITQEFNNTNRWGIRVENTALPGFNQLEDRLRQVIQQQGADSLPEVWPMTTSQALLLDANGEVIADLQPYLFDPEYGLSSSEQADFLPALWQQDLLPAQVVKGSSATQDKRLGLPWVRSGVMLLYNRSWAQELGYARPPQSSQDFQKQACAAAQVNQTDSDRTNDATGGWLVTGDSAELAGWIYAFGGEFTRSDGRGYQFDTPEAHQAAGFIHSLAQQGCAWHGDVVPVEAIATRQALFALVRLADLGDLQNGLDEASVDWTLLPFAPAQEGGLPAIVSYGPSLVMAQSTASRQLAAWLFIRWLTSPENQARWAQINHAFPTRSSALDHLQLAPVRDSAWQSWRQSLEYLPALHSEPYYASWSKVRWSLADGLTQLMLPDLPDSSDNGDRIPLVLQMLDDLAAEIHIQVR